METEERTATPAANDPSTNDQHVYRVIEIASDAPSVRVDGRTLRKQRTVTAFSEIEASYTGAISIADEELGPVTNGGSSRYTYEEASNRFTVQFERGSVVVDVVHVGTVADIGEPGTASCTEAVLRSKYGGEIPNRWHVGADAGAMIRAYTGAEQASIARTVVDAICGPMHDEPDSDDVEDEDDGETGTYSVRFYAVATRDGLGEAEAEWEETSNADEVASVLAGAAFGDAPDELRRATLDVLMDIGGLNYSEAQAFLSLDGDRSWFDDVLSGLREMLDAVPVRRDDYGEMTLPDSLSLPDAVLNRLIERHEPGPSFDGLRWHANDDENERDYVERSENAPYGFETFGVTFDVWAYMRIDAD